MVLRKYVEFYIMLTVCIGKKQIQKKKKRKETNSYFLVVHIKVCIGKTTHCQEFILNGAQKKMEKRKNKPVDKRRLVNNGNCPI